MKRFILILLSFSLLSCSSESLEPENIETDVSKFTEIGHGALTGSEGIPKSNLIIKDSGTWNELMQQMNSKNPETSNFAETEIDFKHYQIIAVFDRVYPKVGYTVDITKIKEHETSVEVTVENLEIGGLLSATRQPYHIVKMPKTAKEVIFDQEPEKEQNDDGKQFCSSLNLEDINKTIPLINEFLAELHDDISKEQTFESLVKWLNSFPCNVDAKLIQGVSIGTGEYGVFGVSISVKDGEITRELELDFSSLNNIVGFVYYKQNAIYVQTEYIEIEKVFEFVNSLDFDVREIQGGIYLSSMAADEDTLQYILNDLRSKPYTADPGQTWLTGHLNWYNANIAIFLRLYDMHNKDYQVDWIETMKEYKFENYGGLKPVVAFYIPEGTGKQWETHFNGYSFVDWAELGHTRYTIR